MKLTAHPSGLSVVFAEDFEGTPERIQPTRGFRLVMAIHVSSLQQRLGKIFVLYSTVYHPH
jgi:hypothetical protein